MYTPFQQAYIQQLQARLDFDKFVDCQMTTEEAKAVAAYTGPRNVLFRTKDNHTHLHRLGQKRVLATASSNMVSNP